MTDEITRLQRCVNDLVSILALPAMWTGREPPQIVQTVLDALLGMLQLDLVCVRLTGAHGEPPIEMVRAAHAPDLRDDEVSIVTLRLGLHGELGVIVAVSQRADFPEQTEALLLTVAANQASIGLREARLLADQKRLASELDRRVAQRTAELAAANEELQKREHHFRLIVDSIPALVALMTPSGEVELVNSQVLDYFGRTLEEMQHWGTSDAVHSEDLPHVIATLETSIDSGRLYEVEHRLRRFDGIYRWFQARGLPLRDTSGRIVRWYVLLTDINDRKRAEEELRRNEAFLAQGQQLSSTGTFAWHVATDDITWSAEIYRIFEFDPGVRVTLELVGSRVHPDDRLMLDDMIRRARDDGGDFEYEHRLQMPDRSVKYVHLVAHGTRDQSGRLEYIGAVQDVTERRLSEQALGRAQAELTRVSRITSLGALTASIAHEVNQPLSGIVTNASTCLRMLAADPPNVDGARETARRTIRDGNRASEVITRLRALFGKKEITTEWVDLNEATREVVALMLSELQGNRVVLRLELADDLPIVTGDRVQLQQVILNLIRNASDAMSAVEDRPRQLLIRTSLDEGDRVLLTVQDAGLGFDPQGVDRLFDAFYTTKSGGMGIGLSVSRSIVESHRGRLWAAPNDGPGVAFSFSIPFRPEAVTNPQHALGHQ